VLRADEIEDWLHGLNLSPVSTNNYAVRVGSMFSYGVKRHYLEANPFTGIAKVKSDDEPPEIFTVDELQKLLLVAPPELIPVLALGAFAGLRSAELVRLGWEDNSSAGSSTSPHESPRPHRGASSRFLIILRLGLRRTQATLALSGRKLSLRYTVRPRRREQTQVSQNGHRTGCVTALPPMTWRSFRTPHE